MRRQLLALLLVCAPPTWAADVREPTWSGKVPADAPAPEVAGPAWGPPGGPTVSRWLMVFRFACEVIHVAPSAGPAADLFQPPVGG